AILKEEYTVSRKICEKIEYLEIIKADHKWQSKKQEENSIEDSQNLKNEKEESQNNLEILKKLKKSEEIRALHYETKTSETSPPSRYNSGSMILAMENAGKLIEEEELREQIKGAGIGTSATRAEIMKK